MRKQPKRVKVTMVIHNDFGDSTRTSLLLPGDTFEQGIDQLVQEDDGSFTPHKSATVTVEVPE